MSGAKRLSDDERARENVFGVIAVNLALFMESYKSKTSGVVLDLLDLDFPQKSIVFRLRLLGADKNTGVLISTITLPRIHAPKVVVGVLSRSITFKKNESDQLIFDGNTVEWIEKELDKAIAADKARLR